MKYFIVLFFLLLLFSCRKDVEIPSEDAIAFSVPKGWPKPFYNFEGNALTQDGFELGRKLFYDKKLSRDGTISCGSCHQQFVAFAHADHPRSHGIHGLFGKRNSPALFNLNWNTTFMADGGVNHITVQPLAPLQDKAEMDNSISNILTYLQSNSDYKTSFKKVFGSDNIDSQKMLFALTQFMGAMVSSTSKYDKVETNESSFTSSEMAGKSLFMSTCNHCHTAPLFTDNNFYNIGLEPNIALQDSGRMRITLLASDRHKFRTPSLRNIELTGPYMHDGRFSSLTMAIDYHINKPFAMPNVDPSISNASKLSSEEIAKIIAFLKTLTDYEFCKDKRFSEPY